MACLSASTKEVHLRQERPFAPLPIKNSFFIFHPRSDLQWQPWNHVYAGAGSAPYPYPYRTKSSELSHMYYKKPYVNYAWYQWVIP